jgi:cytochrome c556
MRTSALPVVLLSSLLVATCAGKKDAVGETTGKTEPQAEMNAQDLEQLMQKIGPAYQGMRKTLQGPDTGDAAKQAQQLAELFGGVEKFWTQHNKPDAVKWAGEARTHASNAAGAAVAGDAAKAAAAAETMGGACKQCHGTYRESDGQGGYRIKPGAIQ